MMFIKHPKFKDVCFEVQNTLFGAYFEGYWWNMGFAKSWRLPVEKVTLAINDLNEWHICMNPILPCLRYESWT